MSIEEIWKPVVGYEDRYQVSNLGRVKNSKRNRLLQPDRDRKGYRRCLLYREGKGVHKKVHRAVLEAFVGPCPDNHETAHEDGNPDNNFLSNLAWKTPLENTSDQIRHGTRRSGERSRDAKLSDDDVVKIRRLRKAGELWKEIHKLWPQVRSHTLVQAGIGKTFSHLSEPPALRVPRGVRRKSKQ